MAGFFYKQDFLNHFKVIQPILAQAGATADLGMQTLRLKVRLGDKMLILHPQFMKVEQGRKQYTPEFGPDVTCFIGWCPYFNKRWELSNEKLKFKAYAAANGLATPEHSADPDASLADVIVKRNVSSFAMNIKGPFKRSKDCPLDREAGEFYERFVAGRSAKIFYWDSTPLCLEIEKAPTVVGDGRRTLRELLEAAAALQGKKLAPERIEGYLRFIGKSFDEVLPFGTVQQVDFRYGAQLNLPRDQQDIDLTKNMVPELEPQLRVIGERLWNGIPAGIRNGTLYTVDGILDSGNKLWLTEMNSNPFIHPFVYPAMFRALFQGEPAAEAEASQARVPQTIGDASVKPLRLALTQLDAGDLEGAVASCAAVLEAQPEQPAALFYSGLALDGAGKLAEARDQLDALVRTAPGDSPYLIPAMHMLASIEGELAASRTLPGAGLPPAALHSGPH